MSSEEAKVHHRPTRSHNGIDSITNKDINLTETSIKDNKIMKNKNEITPLLNTTKKDDYIEPIELNTLNANPSEADLLEDVPIQLDSRRWLVLFLFCLLTFSSCLGWITFAPSADSFSKYYLLDSTYYINFLSTIYMITYPPFLLPALYLSQLFTKLEVKKYNKLNDKGFGFGLRNTILFAASLHVAGCWLRYIAKQNFILNFVGQALASLCQVFTLGMPPKIASVWFGKNELNLAVSIGVTANVFGSAIGFLLTPTAVDPKNLETSIPYYLLGQSIAFSTLFLALFILFPTSPKYRSNDQMVTEPTATILLKSIKELMSTFTFQCFSVSYGLSVGVQYAVQTLITIFILPVFIDRNESQVGWLGFWMLIAGIVTSLIASYLLDRTPHYFFVSMSLYVVTALSLLCINLSLEYKSYEILYIGCIVYGMTSAALMPVMFQYGSILYSNHDETTITGLLNSLAQVFGILLITIMSGLEERIKDNTVSHFTMRVPCWILFGINSIGVIIFALSKVRNKDD